MMPSAISDWLQIQAASKSGYYELTFAEHHLGNIWIRSLHGGVSGAAIEMAAQAETLKALKDPNAAITIISNSIDYLRITRDVNLHLKAEITRLSRRLSVVEVTCWQDDENSPTARGIVTLKITSEAT